MAELHVISALVKKRAELAGELEAYDLARRTIADRLASVDSVLATFGYTGNPNAIKARRKLRPPMFKRGQLRRTIADIGRQRPDLGSNKAIAIEVLSRLGRDAADLVLVDVMREKVKDARKVKRPFASSLSNPG